MKLLFDSNVSIDLIGMREGFYDEAASLMAMHYFDDAQIYTPAQSVTDIFYILSKGMPDKKEIQQKIAEFCRIAKPVALTSKELLRAFELKWNGFEDCLISLAASKIGADYVVTRDIGGFERSAIPAITPEQLLAKIREEKNLEYGEVDVAGL